MYKVTITQKDFNDVSLEYECQEDAFDLINKVLFGNTKGDVKVTIQITEEGE